MTDRPRSAVAGVHFARHRLLGFYRFAFDDARLVRALLVEVTSAPLGARDLRDVRHAEHAPRVGAAGGAERVRLGLRHRPLLVEVAVRVTFEFVDRHGGSCGGYLATAKSWPCGTEAVGPLAEGKIGKLNISVGMAKVAQAFGMSTMPLTRPSTGAVPKMA